ncbi:MAG: hypothetical protein KDD69_06130, partial [Bdellovibrionales bacterium]|nr:hypothetical protein [Bdellovibrionales bacterium]
MKEANGVGGCYELVLEGARDRSADTEWSIKLVLMADCGLDFEEARALYARCPAVVGIAGKEADLTRL